MKYVRKTSKDITDNFLIELLNDRGIIPSKNIQENFSFFSPTYSNELDPYKLDHILEAATLLLSHIKNGSHIRIYIDPDVDGYTSAATLYNYLVDVIKNIYGFTDFTISYHVPEGKEHGLKTVMKELINERICDLIVMPDSSSNDYEEHKTLKEMGYDIIVLDHHEAEKYSENAIVVNNQLSSEYGNKSLSGVGVVYKFLGVVEQLIEKEKQTNETNSHYLNYIDLVALGQISDMMNMTTMENRYICEYGLDHIKNKFFQELVTKQSYSLGDPPLTQIGVAFYITPLINALIRVGSDLEKERLFLAFIEPDTLVDSTKRGEKGKKETIATQSARNCTNAKSRQNREKDKAIELLNIQIIENCLDDNKILILNADDLNVSNTLTGLCAMGVAAEHKKPVMLGRISPDGYLKGSIRGRGESELKDFRAFLLESGLMDFVEGHGNAAGFSIKESNIDKLNDYANEKLKDINFNEGYYEADFIVNGNCSYLGDMITDLDKGKQLWGQNNDEPVIIVENITISDTDIKIIGANKDTLRFTFNGITYVKFKAASLISQIMDKFGKLNITAAGRANINRWNGSESPQILLDEIEIKVLEKSDF